ncbi:fimbrin [Seiridium cupressi]
MRTAAVLATLASAVSATTFKVQAVEGYDWSVTGWSAGCDRSGCYYDFNVSGPADDQNPKRPAFLAYCAGSGEGAPYSECDLLDEADVARQVVAKLLPATRANGTNTIAHIEVSLQYTDLDTPLTSCAHSTTWWNFTGHGDARYNQFVAPLMNFTIKPDTISGAAPALECQQVTSQPGTMNVLKLQRKYPQFEQGDIFGLTDAFRKLDVDDKGYIEEATAIKATQQSERQPYDVVRQALKEVELDSSRRVELEDYVGLIAKLRESSPAQKRMNTGGGGAGAAAPSPGLVSQRTGGGHVSKGSVGKIHVQGSNANITHTINEDERTEFTRHINAVLAGDPDIGARLPFPTDTFEMFDECKDGLVLAKLINDSVPDTIDERVMNVPGRKIKKLNAFHMTENNNIVIESAKGIGCSVVNIGSGDIIEVREHLILGLIWQIIRRGLLGKIDIKLHPELYRLLEEDETLEQFLRLPPEQILLRWFNYHLKAANWPRRVNNFSTDVKDGENYAVLLAQIGHEYGCSRAPLQTRDLLQRAEEVLQDADKLSCRKFLTPTSLVAGNPKLNLAFVANLFNTHPCLDPITEEEKLEVEDFDAEGEREARVFTLWLNSLDVQPAVVSFFDDLRDGTILLQAYDKVIKGSVNWRHVNKRPAHGGEIIRFKAVENTNYAVELGKQNGFSLVGIQGADITDGVKLLTLGLVWQLMRKDITLTLSALAQRLGKREMSDTEMVRWANDQSKKGGRSSSVRSFKDSSIASGIFLLDVLNGMKSSYVDYDLVTSGQTDEEAYMNAKLAISIARKMGATIWLVPEDICQVRSRLVTTFIGSLMATSEKMH